GNSVIYIAIDNKLSGIIAIGDEIKHNAKYVIEQLHSMHKHIILLSGDHKQSVKAIANKLNIDEFHAEVNPIEKGNIIDKLKLNKNNIAMIGDGINDAIALSKANIAIAIGSGSDLAIECADVVLVKDNLEDVLKAFRLSKKTIRNIHQNLFWAFFYNTLGIPIAGGLLYIFKGPLLTPVLAGTAMALSSIFVVGNALRLNKFK
ncbi:MAG: HAD-IC family P-type ATPase, partial [Erysipelotrichaceae bacterium]